MLFALLQVANHLPYQNPYFSFKHVWLQLLPICSQFFSSCWIQELSSHSDGFPQRWLHVAIKYPLT